MCRCLYCVCTVIDALTCQQQFDVAGSYRYLRGNIPKKYKNFVIFNSELILIEIQMKGFVDDKTFLELHAKTVLQNHQVTGDLF